MRTIYGLFALAMIITGCGTTAEPDQAQDTHGEVETTMPTESETDEPTQEVAEVVEEKYLKQENPGFKKPRWVVADKLNLRAEPNLSSTVVKQLKFGDIVNHIGNDTSYTKFQVQWQGRDTEGWMYQVELSDGTTGFLYSPMVRDKFEYKNFREAKITKDKYPVLAKYEGLNIKLTYSDPDRDTYAEKNNESHIYQMCGCHNEAYVDVSFDGEGPIVKFMDCGIEKVYRIEKIDARGTYKHSYKTWATNINEQLLNLEEMEHNGSPYFGLNINGQTKIYCGLKYKGDHKEVFENCEYEE